MKEITDDQLRDIVKSEYPYKGHVLDLRIDHVKFPSGKVKVREVVEHKSAVAMFAVNEKDEICLVSQYRHAVDQSILEIPAGIIEPGENPEDAASRELQEEIGCKPGRLVKISDFYSSPGYSTERIILYYAFDLAKSKLPGDDDEYINTHWFSVSEFALKVANGEINDGKTLFAYYWYLAGKNNNAFIGN